jgi:predicted amidophosphoribosyltransferase
MCGTVVDASVSECPGCGESFSPVEVSEETVTEEVQELTVPRDSAPEPEFGICEACDGPLNDEGKCPTCQPPERVAKASDGCPICAGKEFTKESGDLVSCTGCGNVYVRKQFEPTPQSWKMKFWVGLIFIMIGNVGVALGSYVHNVMQWSPLGDMYLGYGWMDQIVGAIGIVLFILGLILFAWSFKREREIQCPSCKVVIRESEFEIYEPPEEEEVIPKEVSVKSALDEIGEMMECPSCGAEVSMFDSSCSNCGAVFEMDATEAELQPEFEIKEKPAPGKLLSASELDEDEMIMESLELEKDEDHLNGNGMAALDELESAFEIPLEKGITCKTCGARVGKGLDTCPGCGEPLNGGE